MIVRPSIIIASHSEPYPGWTDTLSAAGALTWMIALGIISKIDIPTHTRADLIPVDFVANHILVSTAYKVMKGGFDVMHSGTSHANHIKWFYYASTIAKHYR